ncbi:MAG: TonB family protein [Phormidesmis sp.]
MAFSSRLKSAVRPFYQTAKFVSPTAVGVLLSLGVHAIFFAFGPRTSFSFAALSAVAQQEEAEETIVPILQLTAAERSRLPAFAQPRVLQPSPTGLSGGLGLPFNLSSPNSSQLQRSSIPAGRLPSPTFRTSRPAPTSTFRGPRATTLPPSIFRTLPAPSVTQRPTVSVLPLPTTQLPNGTDGNLSINPGSGTPDTRSIPDLSGTQSTPSAADLQTSSRSIGDALDTAENNQPSNSASSEGTRSPSETDSADSQTSAQTGASQPATIAVQPPDLINVAPAQGDSSRLLEGFVYDPTDVSQAEADENIQAWVAATAENKSEIDAQKADITIDSNFKVCTDNPPADGLIGVVVNPDGTQESAKVLKSIGYDLLNRQALDAVERRDFGQPVTPTQYQVAVEVLYQPAGCVEELPAASEDIDG